MFGAWCKTYNRELVPYVLYHIRGMIFGTQPDAKPSALVFRLPQCQLPLGLKLEPGRGLFVNAVLWAWKDHWPGFWLVSCSSASLPQFMFSCERKDADEAPRTQSILANQMFGWRFSVIQLQYFKHGLEMLGRQTAWQKYQERMGGTGIDLDMDRYYFYDLEWNAWAAWAFSVHYLGGQASLRLGYWLVGICWVHSTKKEGKGELWELKIETPHVWNASNDIFLSTRAAERVATCLDSGGVQEHVQGAMAVMQDMLWHACQWLVNGLSRL